MDDDVRGNFKCQTKAHHHHIVTVVTKPAHMLANTLQDDVFTATVFC